MLELEEWNNRVLYFQTKPQSALEREPKGDKICSLSLLEIGIYYFHCNNPRVEHNFNVDHYRQYFLTDNQASLFCPVCRNYEMNKIPCRKPDRGPLTPETKNENFKVPLAPRKKAKLDFM